MDSIEKKLFCQHINQEVTSTFFIENVAGTNGTIKTKAVTFYNCGAKEKCDLTYDLRDCSCFKEIRRIEVEINKL
jgi:hypothetical protein